MLIVSDWYHQPQTPHPASAMARVHLPFHLQAWFAKTNYGLGSFLHHSWGGSVLGKWVWLIPAGSRVDSAEPWVQWGDEE